MSWKKKDDLGSCLIAKVHDQLRVTDQWSIDVGRGFTFWPSEFATTVSADEPNFHNAYSIFRLHAETEIAKASEDRTAAEMLIASRMGKSALSAMIYDESAGVYKLQCSVYAHCDNADWLSKVFLAGVCMQVSRAGVWASFLKEKLGLAPARSRHPASGLRQTPDAVVGALDHFIIPAGSTPSKWIGDPEWEDAYQVIRRMARQPEADGKTYIRAHFDWVHDAPIRFEATATEPHDEFGNGLMLRLRVPWGRDEVDTAKTAMRLNDLERAEWNWCHDLGTWSADGDELAFICFVPNLSHSPGCLSDLLHDMALRARWVNETAALEVLGVC